MYLYTCVYTDSYTSILPVPGSGVQLCEPRHWEHGSSLASKVTVDTSSQNPAEPNTPVLRHTSLFDSAM